MVFNNEEYIYYIILASTLCLIPIYYKYNNYIFDLKVNKKINSLQELLEYSELYLSDFFSLTSSDFLLNNFLNNKFLFNFLRQLLKLYPSPELLLIDLDFDEKIEIKNFFEMIKKNSFKVFSEYKINKKIFYKLLYCINKNIFCLDI